MDTDDTAQSAALLDATISSGAPQTALREGRVLVPRLVRGGGAFDVLPSSASWRLGASGEGTIEGLALTESPVAPLERGQVRVEVRAAGLNFRDVLIALGMYPGATEMGSEGAGVVTEVGPGVEGLAVGDAVFGLFPAFGPQSVADQRMVTRMPEGVVVRAGRVGAGRVPDGLVRARGAGWTPAR
ncbi:putative protein OS=Streptomyces fumanus OX=67302 GN=GCM10018772_62380 PE=4 SV=1 [Streptomyces fumanus]